MPVSVVVDWLLDRQGIFGLVAALLLSVGLTVFNQWQIRRRKVLSFRVRFNSPLGFDPPDAGAVARLVDQSDKPIPDPGLVVARVKNVGHTSITPVDYEELKLVFPGRRAMTVEITEARPSGLAAALGKHQWKLGQEAIDLPRAHLNRDSEYKVVVLLSNTGAGPKPDAMAIGYMHDGDIVTDADSLRTRRSTIIGAALSTLLAGALVVTLLFASSGRQTKTTSTGPVCASGSLTVEGSSAFGGIAAQLAEQYMTYCDKAKITILASGSFEGLDHLQNVAPQERPWQLALADGKFIGFSALVPSRTVAVVPFSVVVNPSVPLTEISLSDLNQIFKGAARNWERIGASNQSMPIRVVGRDDHSGSRRTLETYVLHGRQADATSDSCDVLREGIDASQPIICEQNTTSDVLTKVRTRDGAIGYVDTPDALITPGVKQLKIAGRSATIDDIRAGYAFWTVEYLYSYGDLDKTDPLTRSFANYIIGAEARSMIAAQQYAPCVRADGNPEKLCTVPR